MNKINELYKNQKVVNSNNKKYCFLENIDENKANKINDFLKDNNNYKQKVKIITNNKVYDTYIITKTKDKVYTLEDEIIPIKEIIDISL